MKDVDGTFNAEMMKLTGDLQSQEVILTEQEKTISDRLQNLIIWIYFIFAKYVRELNKYGDMGLNE